MKRTTACRVALIACAFMPIEASAFVAAANPPPGAGTGQPPSSPARSPVAQPPTYPPDWECPTRALGGADNGFRWGTPYVPSGQLDAYKVSYTVVVQPGGPPHWVLASLTVVGIPLVIRCPVVNSQDVLTRVVENWVFPGNTILEWVCRNDENALGASLTLAGQQLGTDGSLPHEIEDNCGAGGSYDGRGNPKQ